MRGDRRPLQLGDPVDARVLGFDAIRLQKTNSLHHCERCQGQESQLFSSVDRHLLLLQLLTWL